MQRSRKTSEHRPRRIAVLVPGGVGHADPGRNLPALARLVHQLAGRFDITVYSMTRIDAAAATAQRQQPFKIRFVNADHSDSMLRRMVAVARLLIRDHFSRRFDVLHGFWVFPAGFVAVVLAKFFRKASVVTAMGAEAAAIPAIGYGYMLSPRLKMATLWTCGHADILAALTGYQRDQFMRFGLKRLQIHIIPFGADLNLFRPSGKNPGAILHCLHVASLTAVKDQKTLLRAFARIREHRDSRLYLVGPDAPDGRLRELLDDLGVADAVEFVGQVPHDRLPDYYAKTDILLHTSYHEGQGVVIAEAAACGVVVCGTRVGLIADLGDERAIAVEVGQHRQLAESILALLQDMERFDKLRDNALQWAQQYDARWTTAQYDGIYAMLTHEKTA